MGRLKNIAPNVATLLIKANKTNALWFGEIQTFIMLGLEEIMDKINPDRIARVMM